MSYNEQTNEYEGCIYLLTNIINGKQYIGQTTVTIEKRWYNHVKCSKSDYHTIIDRAIRKYGADNWEKEQIDFFSKPSQEELQLELNQAEKKYIKQYETLLSQGGYNFDEGGKAGTVNNIKTDAYDMYGNLLGTYSNRKECARAYNITDNTVIKICKGQLGNSNCKYVFRNHGDPFDKYDITNHPNYRDIYQFDLDGNFIKRYYSFGTIPYSFHSWIHDVIDHPNKTCGGYWWGSSPKFNYQGDLTIFSVDMYDKEGNFIKSFKTRNECALELGVCKGSVEDACNGGTIFCKGFVLRNKGDDFNKYRTAQLDFCNHKMINQYTKNNEYVATHESMKSAANSLGKKYSGGISTVCNKVHGHKTMYGYKWFYADDVEQPDKTKIINY